LVAERRVQVVLVIVDDHGREIQINRCEERVVKTSKARGFAHYSRRRDSSVPNQGAATSKGAAGWSIRQRDDVVSMNSPQ
jgi:hypothetical protein